MLSLKIFGFRALWSPYFLIFLAVIFAVYFLIAHKYRDRFEGSEPLTAKQGIFFSISIVLLYLIKGSPIDLMGHLAFYAHMIQMAFLYLIIPPLLIMGVPQWLWRNLIKRPFTNKLFRFFTKPLIALILFNGMFSIYHIPLVFDSIKLNIFYHAGYTGLLFVLAIFMWWPIVNELPEHQSLNGLKKVGYIFADGVLLTPACALIIFAKDPMYLTFSDPQAWSQSLRLCVPASTLSGLNLSGPELFNNMSLIHDQQLGGVLMKIIQEIVYGSMLAKIFFSWYRKEQEESEHERLAAFEMESAQPVK